MNGVAARRAAVVPRETEQQDFIAVVDDDDAERSPGPPRSFARNDGPRDSDAMGMAKRMMMQAEEQGWSYSDAVVCSQCLDEPILKQSVHHAADTSVGPCTFCGLLRPAASLDVVLELVVDGLRTEYDDPINVAYYDSREGGYQAARQDTEDLLYENDVSSDHAVIEAIARSIHTTEWCDRDLAMPPVGMGLAWSWNRFREEVRTRRRYTFLLPDPAEEDEPGMHLVHEVPAAVTRAVQLADLVIDLPAGGTWWRARVGNAGETFATASDIGPPPSEYARSNRMTAAGISAFYGASTRAGAVGEVSKYADPGSGLSVGEFALHRGVRVLDLRTPPPVPSLFNAADRDRRPATVFLREFIKSIGEPTRPGGSDEVTYIPTQIITEFLRYGLPDGPVDGILWGSTAVDDVDCCVLFATPEECADRGSQTPDTRLELDHRTITHLTV
jgi:hypothetical protein